MAENIDSGKAFKILSYNVWFREDLELHKRMKAIGDLVQLHSPDFICFQVSIFMLTIFIFDEIFNLCGFVYFGPLLPQEVTPNIYDIFKRSTWWSGYRCSVSSELDYSRPYFCMVVNLTSFIPWL